MKTLSTFRARESKTFQMPPSSMTFLVVASFLLGLAIVLGLLLSMQ